jgi:hypothetical protein
VLWVVWGKEVVSKRGFTPRRLPSCGKQRRLFFPFPDRHDCDTTDILIRAISYLLSDYSSTHSWNEGLSTRNVDRSLCIFHYIHESMFVTPSSCKTSPTFRVTRRHWKAHEWDGWDLYMVHHRVCVCVCRAHQRKTIIGFCVQEIIIQVTWN